MNTNELYLKTIFCCMACDGEIALEEVDMVAKIATEHAEFSGMDIERVINQYVAGINANGAAFLKSLLQDLSAAQLNDEEQMRIVDFAVQTICADHRIEYSEVKYFKKIRSRLSLTDERILAAHPDIEDWLLPDIMVAEDPEWDNATFEFIKFEQHEQK